MKISSFKLVFLTYRINDRDRCLLWRFILILITVLVDTHGTVPNVFRGVLLCIRRDCTDVLLVLQVHHLSNIEDFYARFLFTPEDFVILRAHRLECPKVLDLREAPVTQGRVHVLISHLQREYSGLTARERERSKISVSHKHKHTHLPRVVLLPGRSFGSPEPPKSARPYALSSPNRHGM